MYKIVNAECLADKIYLMDVEAPRVARACQPGEFVIVKMDEVGERIPLTICDFDREKGLVTIVFQIVGASTMRMAELKAGDYFQDFVGPLGQPSEFVKILFVFFIASMLYKSTDLKQLTITSGVSAVFVLILVASNDLGGALLYFFTYLVMIYVATKKFYIFAGGLAFVGLGMYAGYHLFSHVKNRIVAWLDPLSVIDKAGYQVCQSLFAIGTGGLFGFGLGQGLPNKIPIVSKDFIIAAISEEMGGIFAVCLIMVCVSCFLMIFNLSMQMKDAFYKYVALGLGSVYALQVLLTVGGSTKFIPMTGVTLPLVSYGGSSLLSTMIIFGMIQGMYIMQAAPEKRRKIDDKRRKDHETKNRQKQTAKEPGAQGSQQRRRKPTAGGKNSTKTQK